MEGVCSGWGGSAGTVGIRGVWRRGSGSVNGAFGETGGVRRRERVRGSTGWGQRHLKCLGEQVSLRGWEYPECLG